MAPVGSAGWLTQFSGNFISGAATVTLQTYLDNSNTLLATTTLLSTLTATTTGAAHVSLDASLTDAPEPASLAILGSALAGLGTLARRRKR
jgi:hypothetical protein